MEVAQTGRRESGANLSVAPDRLSSLMVFSEAIISSLLNKMDPVGLGAAKPTG